jgi:hypothetical protein
VSPHCSVSPHGVTILTLGIQRLVALAASVRSTISVIETARRSELYVAPKPDPKGESLPESYASVVKQVLPNEKLCGADTWAFLRSGNEAPSKDEQITLAEKLRSAITIEHRVGPCCSGATGHLCLAS